MESSRAALLLITSRFAIAVSVGNRPLSWRSSARSSSIKWRPSVSLITERTMLDVGDIRTFIEVVDAGGLMRCSHQ